LQSSVFAKTDGDDCFTFHFSYFSSQLLVLSYQLPMICHLTMLAEVGNGFYCLEDSTHSRISGSLRVWSEALAQL